MGGGGGVSPPEQSPEQKALFEQQTELLQFIQESEEGQLALTDLLQGPLFEQLGFKPTFGGPGVQGPSTFEPTGPAGQATPEQATRLASLQAELNNLHEFDEEDGEEVENPEFRKVARRIKTLQREIAASPGTGQVEIPGVFTGPDPGTITGFERVVDPQQTLIEKLQTGVLESQVEQFELQRDLLGDLRPQIEQQFAQQQAEADLRTQVLERALAGFDSPQAQARADIEQQFLQRAQDALAGNLPVNPALERSIGLGQTRQEDLLRRQLGRGFETSTPGIEALREFRSGSEQLREQSRRADLQSALQGALNVGGFNQQSLAGALGLGGGTLGQGVINRQSEAANLAGMLGIGGTVQGQNLSALGGQLGGIGSVLGLTQGPLAGMAGVFGGLGQQSAQLQQQQNLGFQAQAANQQASSSALSGLLGAAGTIAGAYFLGPWGASAGGAAGSAAGNWLDYGGR